MTEFLVNKALVNRQAFHCDLHDACTDSNTEMSIGNCSPFFYLQHFC